MDITIAKEVEVAKKWMNKENAMKFFEFEPKQKRTFGRLLSEFKMHPEFCDGYMNPTYKLVLIDIVSFEKFLRWKSANKFK